MENSHQSRTDVWRYECGHNFRNKSEKWREKRAKYRWVGGVAEKMMHELNFWGGRKELEWKPEEKDVPETRRSRKTLADCKF